MAGQTSKPTETKEQPKPRNAGIEQDARPVGAQPRNAGIEPSNVTRIDQVAGSDEPDGDTPATPRPPRGSVAKPKADVPEMPKELFTKKQMAGYIAQYGYTPKDYEGLFFTQTERLAYEKYRKAHGETGLPPREMWLAAFRMLHFARLPVRKPEATDLAAMAVE